jgi:hypothetical protein
MSRCAYPVVWIGVGMLLLAGCGPGGPKTYPVTGKVTIQGQATADVAITFQPVDPAGPVASGRSGADGSYTLYTGVEGKPGAPVGKYKVVLSGGGAQQDPSAMYSGAKGPPKAAEGPVPKEYTSAATTPKEVEVKPQPNTIDIGI